jgi:hypothetical protein
VTEQQVVIGELGRAGVLSAVQWAYWSAVARSLDLYDEDGGLDAAWLGNTRFTFFRDRLDRVCGCERYAVHSGDENADLDLLHAQLTKAEADAMPSLPVGLVRRSNLTGSPGWVFGRYRLLLAAGAFGKLDQIPWPRRSPTKQRVARQRDPEPPQPSLFDDFAEGEVEGLATALAETKLDLVTFVIAHSLDPFSQRVELVLGRPQMNEGGGPAWRWRQNILAVPPPSGGRRPAGSPTPSGPDTAPDAPVRLRDRTDQRRGGRASDRR